MRKIIIAVMVLAIAVLAAPLLAAPLISITQTITQKIVEPTPSYDGGGGAPTYYIKTDLFGVTDKYRISYSGKLREAIENTSKDDNLTITIPKRTIALDKYGKRLKELEVSVDKSPPDPPEDAHIIGLAYKFKPSGATFDPAITFTWRYDHYILPTGIVEKDLVLAYHDGEAWIELECIVDTKNNTITASAKHFTTFAIIGTITPPVPVSIPGPAAFSISSLSITPREVAPNEPVIITAAISNTGESGGAYDVVLKVNDVKEAKKRIALAAGSSQVISFNVAREDVGIYSVAVNELSSNFVVTAPVIPPTPKPTNWPLIIGIIAAVVIAAIIFLVRKKKREDA